MEIAALYWTAHNETLDEMDVNQQASRPTITDVFKTLSMEEQKRLKHCILEARLVHW